MSPPDPSRLLPVIAKPKGRMSEAEARVVGAAASRIVNLRHLYNDCNIGGSLSVATRNGTVSQALTKADLQAILALMIEREALVLIQFDVDIDEPTFQAIGK